MTDPRRPIHLVVMVGAATTVYAVSLAGVTTLQSESDRAFADRQAPAQRSAERLAAGHDWLQADIERAASTYGNAAERYGELASTLDALEAGLDGYAGRVEAVSGAARALPQRVRLPAITRQVTTTAAKPRVSASTGASGG